MQLLHGPCRNKGAGWVRGIAPECKLLFWGAIQSPKRIVTPICDSLGSNGMAEVTVKNNFGYSLLTVVTLGIWSPARVEWKCGKPCAKDGVIK
ncbi:Bor/Iss family lipoprotein [Mucilaginibacter sp. P25]|uniref:Bor/Iss family lipoprotein n=1 Tax=unclassified Mucilaginibacter TaxID=2617802 RepID=UPI003D672192